MWMDEFVMKVYDFVMKVYDFRGIYRIFGVKIVIGLSKNRCDLFITVGFDFGSNLTVGSSYIRYKSF